MTVQLFNSILKLTTTLKIARTLNTIIDKPSIFKIPIYSNNFIVKYNNYNTNFRNNIEYHNLKCWKSKCIFNNYIENMNENNMIFALEFNINKENKDDHFIKIDYLYTNNDYYDINPGYKKYGPIKLINDSESKLIRESLINYIENWAIKENITKIIIDVHSNLKRFNYELKELGFITTNRCCLLNPYWIEAEKIIKQV